MDLTPADAYNALSVIHSNGLNAIVALHGLHRNMVAEQFLSSLDQDEAIHLDENQPDFTKRIIDLMFEGTSKTVVVCVNDGVKSLATHPMRVHILNHMIHLRVS
jgi:hypothetical protein